MKKLFTILSIVAICFSSCSYDDTDLTNRVENLENRVTALEKLCKEMNSNITALQTIVEALQNNDYVTGVTPVEENGVVVGYTITFVKSAPITIYHGKDGKDGANGSDGKDGYTPVIGVEKDSDGIYYWTLDGEWLTDNEGNKIKAVGVDGKDGVDGEDGKDGITPQLKIENDYWYISYDNGATWAQLGKATGEDGQDGTNGSNGLDGEDGDSFFQGVDISDDEYVIFTLADGTQIKLPTWYAFEQLKKQCEEMNQNISAMQQILEALQNNDYVTSVQQIVEDGKTIGYTIYFSKSGAVTIYHGEDGKDGVNGSDGHSPVVGVRQDSDGIYYWTLDGEWLTDDNGNKIKAVGINGITPLLKIENEYWFISYDNGTSWTQLGKATGKDGIDGTDGDAFFQSVTQDEQYVYFTLADGTKITLPKGALLDVVFDASNLVIMSPNTTREIGYTVTSVTESVTVEVVSSSDIKAKVVAADASGKSGNIVITTSAVIDEYSKVIIFVSNGEKVVMKSIGFEQSGLEIIDSAVQKISADGGIITLSFMTNAEYDVVVPESAKGWISFAPHTRGVSAHNVSLSIDANTTTEVREAVISIVTSDKALTLDFTIVQGVFDFVMATTHGTTNWEEGDAISLFKGDNTNLKYNYAGEHNQKSGHFVAATIPNDNSIPASMLAVFPYSSLHSSIGNKKISMILPGEQLYADNGLRREYDTMVALYADNMLYFKPVCAYLCVRLWGKNQTIKHIVINSIGGEALSGAAIITPNVGGVPQCQMTGAASSIKLSCRNEVTIGASSNVATEFWIAVPAVALAQGYSLTVAGFYGGEQTITFADAISFVAGETYTATSEVNISTNGPGVGVGGWGDGESVEGEI